MESILETIKKLLGITIEDTSFDTDIVVFINSAFMDLLQLNVGPSAGFSIRDTSSVWNDFLADSPLLDKAKEYIYIKSKLVFDPPSSSFVLEALDRQLQQAAFRLVVEAEPPAS